MAMYQDKIMDQIKSIGKPRETKSTTKTTAEPMTEGLDIGSLMMMLMMMNMFKQPPGGPGGLASTLGPEMPPAARLMGGMPGQAPGALESQRFPGGNMLAEILMALMGGAGGGMGGGAPGLPF